MAGLRLKEGEDVGSMTMFRIGNYPGALDKGEGGGFTIKSIHMSKGNLPASSFSGVLRVQSSRLIFDLFSII